MSINKQVVAEKRELEEGVEKRKRKEEKKEPKEEEEKEQTVKGK